jgi:hypothetical protein
MVLFGSSQNENERAANASTSTMKNEELLPSLTQIEAEVMAEGREWTRRRLQERLQQLADQQGEVFPPKPTAAGASAPARVSSAHRRRRGKH